jgi:spore coat protein H
MRSSDLRALLNRRSSRRVLLGASLAGVGGLLLGCSDSKKDEQDDEPDEAIRPFSRDEASHSPDAAPNYALVFPEDRVNQMTIRVTPRNWQVMIDDATSLLGPLGGDSRESPGKGRQGVETVEDAPERVVAQPRGRLGGANKPVWVPATIEFSNETWSRVGLRFKGFSSLRTTWRRGSLKLPLKLDFDEFEGDYPEIKNQRFHGFKQLSLANGYGDATFLREVTAYGLLADAGLPASKTAHYQVLLDHGEGPEDLGLYVAIEVVDDTAIARHFGHKNGNIYEADGAAASLSASTRASLKESFFKENNEQQADWSDIEALYAALHASSRASSPSAWRAGLEKVFDVPMFLEWLALGAALRHWDTYGGMPHNFYLYNNPDDGRLKWISWDHNLVLERPLGKVSYDKQDIDAEWPLIRYLLDDPGYAAAYRGFLQKIAASVFLPEVLSARYRDKAGLIRPYAVAGQAGAGFDAEVQRLIEVTTARAQSLKEYLATI